MYCGSSSGDSVNLLSKTICTVMVVCDWCITSLAHGWWVLIQSIVGIIRGGNRSLGGWLWYGLAAMSSVRRHPRFRNFNSSVPVDFVRVKSYANSLFNSTRVPVRVLVNKLNLVPEWIMPGHIGIFRNSWSFSLQKPHIPIVPLNLFMHAPSRFTKVNFAAFTRNLTQTRWYKWFYSVNWHYHLMKTYSMRSKLRNQYLHSMWQAQDNQ